MPLKLITSGAYIDMEFAAEFGRLPPAFLPVGHRRLYDAQLKALSQIDGDTVLTIPESYIIPDADQLALKLLNVRLLQVPDDMRLGEAILYALEMLSPSDTPICILHGDTLMRQIPSDQSDVVAVVHPPESYDWGVIAPAHLDRVQDAAAGQEVLAGYFAFSDERALRRSLARSRGDFLEALRLYDGDIPLKRLHADDWLDFGHLQTYYRSRCSIQTQRAFNELDLSFSVVKKSSENTKKIEAEAFWFQNIPSHLRLYTPAFLGLEETPSGRLAYVMEYLPLPTLHELFVFGDLSEKAWRQILKSCGHFVAECRTKITQDAVRASSPLSTLVREKTPERLFAYASSTGVSTDAEWRFDGRPTPSLSRIAELATEAIDFDHDLYLGIMHGDFCFTNIFYDFRTQRVRVIDPRGMIDNCNPSVWGDVRYDLAKLCHSIIGGYDLILAGRFDCSGVDQYDATLTFAPARSFATLAHLAEETDFFGLRLTSPEILAITIHLFLSMLPLHQDAPHRQRAFVANALRLFRMLEDRA